MTNHTNHPPSDERLLFASRLREERLRHKLTLRDISDRSGLQQSYISEVESGIRNPTLDTMAKLANAVGVPADQLFRLRRR